VPSPSTLYQCMFSRPSFPFPAPLNPRCVVSKLSVALWGPPVPIVVFFGNPTGALLPLWRLTSPTSIWLRVLWWLTLVWHIPLYASFPLPASSQRTLEMLRVSWHVGRVALLSFPVVGFFPPSAAASVLRFTIAIHPRLWTPVFSVIPDP